MTAENIRKVFHVEAMIIPDPVTQTPLCIPMLKPSQEV